MFNNNTPSTKLLFVLDISHILFHIILTKKTPQEMYYYPNFMSGEIEAGKDEGTCPRSPSHQRCRSGI